MSTQTAVIRPMVMADLAAVSDLDERCESHPWGPANFQGELLRVDNGWARVMLSGDVLVGYLCTWMIVDELHIGVVGIAPEARRHGYGRQLMEDAHTWAKAHGGTVSYLEVRASNAAGIALYTGLGYRQVGRRRGYYPDNHEDALLMLADL